MATYTATGGQSPITIIGLAGGEYTVTVVATNATGTGGSSSSAAVTVAGGSVLAGADFADTFTTLDLKTPSHPTGVWMASPSYVGNGYGGFSDYGSNRTWNANPNQDFGGSVGILDPFTIGSLSGATDGVGLSIAVRGYTGGQAAAVGRGAGQRWGGFLVMNEAVRTFRFGYFEWRMQLPVPGSGMWPALWLYAPADGSDGTANKGRAEIDLVEIFGNANGRPWASSVHEVDNSGANSGYNGSRNAFYQGNDDTSAWHSYGVHWTSSELTFYKDRTEVASLGASDASYYSDIGLSPRMNYTLWGEPGLNGSTPDPLVMNIDYFAHWTDLPF